MKGKVSTLDKNGSTKNFYQKFTFLKVTNVNFREKRGRSNLYPRLALSHRDIID